MAMQRTGIDALRAATEILGSQYAVADAAGVRQPGVNRVLKRGQKVPAEWCIGIERATGGKITRHQLRPDLYPLEGDQASEGTAE